MPDGSNDRERSAVLKYGTNVWEAAGPSSPRFGQRLRHAGQMTATARCRRMSGRDVTGSHRYDTGPHRITTDGHDGTTGLGFESRHPGDVHRSGSLWTARLSATVGCRT